MPGFVTCVPVNPGPSVAPCPDAADGSAQTPVVIQLPAPGDVNFANSDVLFAYGFSAVVMVYLFGLAIGAILSIVRKA